MDSVIRTACIYFFLMLVFRIAGKRTLTDLTLFDFILLLIISEATQQSMTRQDYSLVNGFLVVGTLVALDITVSLIKQRLPGLERILEGTATIIVEDGKPLKERLTKERIDVEDIMEAAREKHGLMRMQDIKFAVLEKSGKISIIPRK